MKTILTCRYLLYENRKKYFGNLFYNENGGVRWQNVMQTGYIATAPRRGG